jgi:hypothetical protein
MRFFELFMGAFSSAAAYRYMRRERRGLGLSYSFLLVALTSILFAVYATAALHAALFAAEPGKKPRFDDIVAQIAEQLPEMTVTDGTLTVTSPQPHYVKLHTEIKGESVEFTVLTIDTTGQTTFETMRTPLLVTSKEVIARNKEKIEIHPIEGYIESGSPPLVLDRATIDKASLLFVEAVHQNLWKILTALGLFLWFFLTMGLYLFRITMMVALGAAGLAMGSLFKSPLDYATSMRLAALAYTPVSMADIAALGFAGINLPPALLFMLGVGMLGMAIRITREDA